MNLNKVSQAAVDLIDKLSEDYRAKLWKYIDKQCIKENTTDVTIEIVHRAAERLAFIEGMVAETLKFVEDKKRQGWTQQDFADGLKKILESENGEP